MILTDHKVRSTLLECQRPTARAASSWHSQHYHPYSRNRNTQQTSLAHSYLPQSTVSHTAWSYPTEYGHTTCATTVPWSQAQYASAYPMYQTENSHLYAGQSPSYMLPNPDSGRRVNLSYMYPVSQSQSNSLWMETLANEQNMQQNAQISPAYPLTPAESTKSYPLMSSAQIEQMSMNHGRNSRSGTPMPTAAIPLMPNNGNDTPPMSAVSHRSSHTWDSESGSYPSNNSSRTSCGSSQDLSGEQILSTCDDQTAVYPYSVDAATSHVTIPASALPIATDTNEADQNQSSVLPVMNTRSSYLDSSRKTLRGRTSRDSVRTASPVSTIYGYPHGVGSSSSNSKSLRTSSSLYQHHHPPRLLTSGFTNTWVSPPASATADPLSAQQQQHDELSEYNGQKHGSSSLSLSATF